MARELLVYASMNAKAPRSRRLLISHLLSATLCGATPLAAWPEAGTGTGPGLEDLVRATAAAHLPAPTASQRLEIGPIRSPAPPADCAGRLQAGVAPGLQAPGRVLIELRCQGPSRWTLYVPARLVGTTPVVLARHAIIAGTVLGLGDLVTEQHDVTALPPGYLNDPAIALGMTASRAIAGGAILTNQQLAGTKTVQRGQTVTLLARADGISVRMPGKALADGFVNQRVRVENLSSGRIVEGIARSDQLVEIVLQ